jgi:hypothetical protein
MNMSKLTLMYFILILSGLTYVDMRGYTSTSVDHVDKVPRSIRDNPGAYRAHYHYHYTGGK